MKMRIAQVFLVLMGTMSCSWHGAKCEFQDLTYKYNQHMSRHPLHTKYNLYDDVFAGPLHGAPWVNMKRFETGEHIGTHLDAPSHFLKGGKNIGDIEFSAFHGPAVILNITERALKDGNAAVLVADLEAWESRCGKIKAGAWILMKSGWGRFWGDDQSFMGTIDGPGDDNRWPGFSGEAAQWLLDNRPQFNGVAVDTISCDTGYGTAYNLPVHVKLLPREKLCVENIASIEKLPERCDMELHVLPMNLEKGTGAPTRVYATWGKDNYASAAGRLQGVGALWVIIATLVTYTYFYI